MAESSPGNSAWLLALDPSSRAAVGERELIQLIETPTLLNVPLSPTYCRQVLVWNQTLLPVMDLAAWLHQQPAAPHESKLAGIVGYQAMPGAAPAYGALLLAGIPERIRVADDQACLLPKRPVGWRNLAIACFNHGGQPIPVLDLPHIFSGGLR
jgi:chemotaxis signal transduction protein